MFAADLPGSAVAGVALATGGLVKGATGAGAPAAAGRLSAPGFDRLPLVLLTLLALRLLYSVLF